MPCSLPVHPPPTERKARIARLGRKLAGICRIALYATVTALALWLVIHFPDMAAARSQAYAHEILAVDQENHDYCEKWGMQAGTHAHMVCVLDLKELRQTDRRRMIAALGSNGF